MLGAALGLATIAALWLVARGLAYWAAERRPSVVWALVVALLVLGLAGFGRLTQDLWAATGLILVSAAVAIAALWRRHPVSDAPPFAVPRLGRLGWAGALLVFGLGAYCAFQGYWWDEYSCHYPITASLARGILPAEHPLFPGELFRYHYAFDLLAGWVRALTHVNVAVALDVVSVGALGLVLYLARDLGAQLGGRAGARLMPVLLLLGTGTLYFLLFTDAGTLQVRWDAIPQRWLQAPPPPTISNFFQHPQGLGMPLALAVLLLFDRGLDDPRRTRRTVLAALVMAALSLSQIVFFGSLGLVLAAATVLLALKARRRVQVVVDGALLLGSLGLAYLLGGFFAAGAPVQSMLVFGRSYFSGAALETVAFHLMIFGLPLIALPFALLRVARRPDPLRLPITLAALMGFAIPHFVTYDRSWDIVKFLGVGAFFANVLFADTLARWPRPGVGKAALRFGVVGALVLASTVSSWIWMARMGVLDGHFGIPAMHFPPPSRIGEVTARRLEGLIDKRDYVFSTHVEIARAGGIFTPGFDWRQVGQGFMLDRPRSERLARLKARARRSLDPKSLAGLEVRWMVLSDGDRAALDAQGRARLEDPSRFELVETVKAAGQTRYVYRVRPEAWTD